MTMKKILGRAKRTSKWVVRLGSLNAELYLNAKGEWGTYKAAKRFSDPGVAETFYRRHHTSENFGLFPA